MRTDALNRRQYSLDLCWILGDIIFESMPAVHKVVDEFSS